jgi:hypothetical protein
MKEKKMYLKNYKIIVALIIGMVVNSLEADVKIVEAKGKVMVRFGIEESWHKAQIGSILKNIDSILSGEDGNVILELEGGIQFKIGANTILDVADIREIQQRELFMYLMSQKLDKLETPDENTPVKVGNVSIVHGDSKQVDKSAETDKVQEDWYPFEVNGALALYDHHYYPNTIIKCMKIQNKYDPVRDEGKIDYYIAKSFEGLNDSAQARDAYQKALDEHNQSRNPSSQEQSWVADAREALHRLNQE